MDRLDAMQVFVAVADAQGFSAAARRLRRSPASLTRAVAALEEHLGARLFHRTTRTVRLTAAGTRYLADCKRLLAEIADADAAAAGAHAEPAGLLSVTAPIRFGRLHMAPLLMDFMARYPRIAVRAIMLDRVVDLAEEGLDVAVRIGALPDSALTAVRVGEVRPVVCASPAYLARRGVPQVPRDLVDHDAITFTAVASTAEWPFGTGAGREVVRAPARMIFNTADLAVAAALAGHGVTRLLSYQVAREVARGALTIVLADFEPPAVPIHVVYREGRRAAARVRVFVDFAVARLRARAASWRIAR